MKPTAYQFKQILRTAKRLQKEEEAIDRALGNFLKLVSPTQYANFLESLKVQAYCEGLEIIFPGISEDISYYLYEVPNIAKINGKCECKDKDGNVYDANNLGSYVKFLLSV